MKDGRERELMERLIERIEKEDTADLKEALSSKSVVDDPGVDKESGMALSLSCSAEG